jgi:hypothetical protein
MRMWLYFVDDGNGEQERQCMYSVTLRRVREISVVVEKQEVLHVLSVCVCVALVIQSVKRMRSIMLSSGACPAVANFSALSFNRHDFRGKSY